MKSLSELSIDTIQPMQEFLTSQGKEANFTSEVFLIIFKDRSREVLKLPGNYNEVIAEVVAFKVSKYLKLHFVPKTKIFPYKENIGSLQTFVDNTASLSKKKYKKLISSTKEDIIDLKLFCFLLGQWDIHKNNILFTKDGKIWAIDNANIADNQKIATYGTPIFVQKFCASCKDIGSIKNPIKVQGDGKQILSELNKIFGEELPKFFKNSLPTSERRSFEYFIEGNRAWIKLNDKEGTPDYVISSGITSNIINQSIKKFNNLTNIFKALFKESIEEFEIAIGNKAESFTLNEHFNRIAEDVETRYELLTKHFALEVEVDLSGFVN